MKHGLVLACSVAAACTTATVVSPRAPKRVRERVPFARVDTRAYVKIFLPPEDGIPRDIVVPVELVFDPAQGMHARITTSTGEVEWIRDGTRAWTIDSTGCSVEDSCDASIRRWFDIGWGYAELTQFLLGRRPHTPGWIVKHRGVRRYPMPTQSRLLVPGKKLPAVVVGWNTFEPARVDLAPAIGRARATRTCPRPSPRSSTPATP